MMAKKLVLYYFSPINLNCYDFFNQQGAQGETGAKGEDGLKGAQGDTGKFFFYFFQMRYINLFTK